MYILGSNENLPWNSLNSNNNPLLRMQTLLSIDWLTTIRIFRTIFLHFKAYSSIFGMYHKMTDYWN